MWWDNASNTNAQNWKKIYENCNDTYSWPYDEVTLKNFTLKDTFDSLMNVPPGSNWATSDLIKKCAPWGTQTECDKTHQPYLENTKGNELKTSSLSGNKPLKVCNFNTPIPKNSIVITITDIL